MKFFEVMDENFAFLSWLRSKVSSKDGRISARFGPKKIPEAKHRRPERGPRQFDRISGGSRAVRAAVVSLSQQNGGREEHVLQAFGWPNSEEVPNESAFEDGKWFEP